MKKILISLMTLVVMVGLVGAGAFALFFDTETSSGNTFQAGTIDLTLTESVTMSFSLPPGMKPGDTASGTFTVNNIGTLPGSLYATSWYVETDMSGAPAPNMSAGAVADMLLVTSFTADGVAVPIPDTNPDGRTTVWDMVNDGSGVTLAGYPASPGQLGTWYSYDANMASGGNHIYVLAVQFDPAAGNQFQGDGMTLRVKFLLTQ